MADFANTRTGSRINEINLGGWGEDSVKSLLFKHEGLKFIPRTQVKIKPVVVAHAPDHRTLGA